MSQLSRGRSKNWDESNRVVVRLSKVATRKSTVGRIESALRRAKSPSLQKRSLFARQGWENPLFQLVYLSRLLDSLRLGYVHHFLKISSKLLLFTSYKLLDSPRSYVHNFLENRVVRQSKLLLFTTYKLLLLTRVPILATETELTVWLTKNPKK